ncbi:MAG: hypothetical protein GXP59_03890 [Deltaproteobacteria bacterium]|nr:hypothetical protein [Deltaproteobacteria bacterium]
MALKEPPTSHRAVDDPQIYRIKFREGRQPRSVVCNIQNLRDGELVMVQTDHGLEPAVVFGFSISSPEPGRKKSATIVRRANREEIEKYTNWVKREEEAFAACLRKIDELSLPMKLVRVERYFNGRNIVFYFTADNRVDFRGLVKSLVEEFRTRVEMRQVGVRHETKMIGGIGYCGRELCCSSFMKKFMPVSIKMVKEQELPLNPTKISGVCNRLLCCLTHEFSNYKTCKKGMPKLGKIVELDGRQYKIVHRNILEETVKLAAVDGRDDVIVLGRDEWNKFKMVAPGLRVQGKAVSPKPTRRKSATKAPDKSHGGGRHRAAGVSRAGLPGPSTDKQTSAVKPKKKSTSASARPARRPGMKRTRRSRRVKK